VKFSAEEFGIDAADVDASKPVVQLASDVARVFKDAAAVNNALRKIIEAMPGSPPRRRSA
jgi:hypothetical protein